MSPNTTPRAPTSSIALAGCSAAAGVETAAAEMVMAAPGAEQRVRFFGRSYLKPRVRDRFRPARDGVKVFALLKHATGRTGMHRPFCADLHGWRDAGDPFLISHHVASSSISMRTGETFGALIERVRFAADSALEGDGFELPVPRQRRHPSATAG